MLPLEQQWFNDLRDRIDQLTARVQFLEKESVHHELVEALKKCEHLLVSYGDPFDGDDWQLVQDVRAVIAKATPTPPPKGGA